MLRTNYEISILNEGNNKKGGEVENESNVAQKFYLQARGRD